MELLITVAILSVLLAVAIPSFQAQLDLWRVKSRAQDLLGAVMMARSAAITSGQPVRLCPWNDVAGLCEGVFTQGFAVVDEGGQPLRVYAQRSGLDVRNKAGTREEAAVITWNAQGLGDRNLTLSVCGAQPQSNVALVLNRVGRPRLVKNWGSCPS